MEYNFPAIYNFGDITEIDLELLPDFDLLVGGWPCQGFSSAGKLMGLEDHRSGLFFYISRILNIKKPKFFLLENVDNLLKVNNGEDFKLIKDEFSKAGYSFVWQVCNTADFGIPIQRSRIFIAGYLGELPEHAIPFGEDDSVSEKTRRQTLPVLTATDWKGPSKQRARIIISDKKGIRALSPLERERLLTWPDDWTKFGINEKGHVVNISNTQRIKMTGNGVCSRLVNILINHFFEESYGTNRSNDQETIEL